MADVAAVNPQVVAPQIQPAPKSDGADKAAAQGTDPATAPAPETQAPVAPGADSVAQATPQPGQAQKLDVKG